MKGSPIYQDTMALCVVLIEEIETVRTCQPLCHRLTTGALRLVDHITLALSGFERQERLQDADAELLTLRTHLHLALELNILSEDEFLNLVEQADLVGRQIGGWLKKMAREDTQHHVEVRK
jgi:hypothetical protein